LRRHPVCAICRIVTVEARPDESSPAGRATQDVIVDTDIGTDIDDAYAVLLAISSPELNLKGITVVHGDIETRARIALKLLKLAGRADVPVLLGERYPVNRERPIYWAGHEGRGIDFSDIEPALQLSRSDILAPEFIARTAAERPGELLLVTIGPLTNVGVAFRDYPRDTAHLKGIVAMASTFNGFGPESAGVEHNVVLDPEAAEIVLNSGIPILLVGLNVTRQTALARSHLAQIASARTPLADFMAHMTEDWLAVVNRDSTAMHDPLAVAASFEPAVVATVPVKAEVSRETAGLVTYSEPRGESPIRIAASTDLDRFNELFFSRILGAVEQQQGRR